MAKQSTMQASIRRHQLAGLFVVLLVAGGIGGWAATTEISGAVIAPGALVVETHVKKVQHPTGGVIGEIHVRDGDLVKAGDILVHLDDTVTRSRHAIVTRRLIELKARKARLEAERDEKDAVTIPSDLTAQMEDPIVADVVAGEKRLFEVRRSSRTGQEAQLRQRLEQLEQEISGLESQVGAKSDELVLIQKELASARKLWAKNLMPISKFTAIEREATRVDGERAKLISDIARTKAQVSETELQIIQIQRNLASEVARELGDIDAAIGEYFERKTAAEDELQRIEIRAPQAGVVHQSVAHTVGGVINAGEVIMLIVPESDDLRVEAKVSPADIDQLEVGQSAMLRLSALNQRTTPEISGSVTHVSADVATDPRSGGTYYIVRVAMNAADIMSLGDVALVPGMPVEVFIKTDDRNVLSYLVKPLTDQIARAFREQ